MLKDNNRYKKIETDPLKELRKSTFKLLHNVIWVMSSKGKT